MGQLEEGTRQYAEAVNNGDRASDCIACGQCKRACPQQINVITRLKDCAENTESAPSDSGNSAPTDEQIPNVPNESSESQKAETAPPESTEAPETDSSEETDSGASDSKVLEAGFTVTFSYIGNFPVDRSFWIISFMTSPAIISPTAGGTKALDPGISLRKVHFLAVPGGHIQ